MQNLGVCSKLSIGVPLASSGAYRRQCWAQDGAPSEPAVLAGVPDAADARAGKPSDSSLSNGQQRKQPWWEMPGFRQETR